MSESKIKAYPSNLADLSPCNDCQTAKAGCINNCGKVKDWAGQCVNKLQELEKIIDLPNMNRHALNELQELAEIRNATKRVVHPAKAHLTETDIKILQIVDRLF